MGRKDLNCFIFPTAVNYSTELKIFENIIRYYDTLKKEKNINYTC